MPLFRPFTSFKINNMDEYNDLCILLDRQIEVICRDKTILLTKIAVREALNNAIEHGSFPVNIEFSNLTSGEFVIKVKDCGEGFLVNEKIELIRNKGADQLLEERLLEERGRGILIMFKAASKVIFNDKGNEVSLFVSN